MQRSDQTSESLAHFWQLLSSSGLFIAAIGFSALVASNLITLYLGPEKILLALNSGYWGVLLSATVYDSWGTVFGLFGVVLLFTPVLFGVPKSFRKSLSVFFLCDSIGAGVVSAVVWNHYYNSSGSIPYGASSIAISAQAIIFTMSIVGLFGLWKRRNSCESMDSYWRNSLALMYITLVATTLWFVLVLEPIFVPSEQYNWRVHEFGFFLALLSSVGYCLLPRFIAKKSSTLE